jgi:hypothetical protein
MTRFNMDTYSKVVLTIIALALCAITLKLFNPLFASNGLPTRGDFLALRSIPDGHQRKEAFRKLVSSLPVVWIQGGQIDADVSGSVSVDSP